MKNLFFYDLRTILYIIFVQFVLVGCLSADGVEAHKSNLYKAFLESEKTSKKMVDYMDKCKFKSLEHLELAVLIVRNALDETSEKECEFVSWDVFNTRQGKIYIKYRELLMDDEILIQTRSGKKTTVKFSLFLPSGQDRLVEVATQLSKIAQKVIEDNEKLMAKRAAIKKKYGW